MRKLQFIVFGLILLFGQALLGNIINIPDDYPTIQQGIDASVNGDTVLVQLGTYVENINYNGKNITVASLFYTTLDTSYISSTIIDGDSLDSVVKFANSEDSTAILTGFTITNGNANYGGGIYCSSSNPKLDNITITGNSANRNGGGIYCTQSNPNLKNVKIIGNAASKTGGGIYCSYSSASLVNVAITDNSAGLWGGGIYCSHSSPSLVNVTITGNYSENAGGGFFCSSNSNPILEEVIIIYNSADNGGGIYCINSSPSLENVTITSNSAYYCGGGIYLDPNSNISFHNENKCNIYLNSITNSKGYGADIFANYYDTINVIVDTFTVINPSDYYASPIDNFNFDIIYGIQDSLINSDLYVSVDGDDSNIGTLPSEPLKTIRCALSKIYADSLNHNTINLLPGVYSSSTNGEIFPIVWCNYVSLVGSGENETILDADSVSRIMEFYYVNESIIKNITIRNGFANYGGGIYFYHSYLVLENVTIIDNSGGGIRCYYSSPTLESVTITNNSAIQGGGIKCNHSNPILVNVTITCNSALENGGAIYCDDSNPILLNCILWNDYPQEIYFYGEWGSINTITISYSDIQGDSAGIVTNNNGTVNWLEGNIDADPLFVDPENGDYHLSWANYPIPDSTMSPCIDAGNPDPQYNDPDGTRNDMGAYYFDQTVGVDDENHTSIETELFKNYPNPFNKITTIRYFLPKYSEVKIQIYNLKGQLVETIVDSNKPTGYYTIEWNAKDMSSGIYFYKLSTKDKTFIKKMILLK